MALFPFAVHTVNGQSYGTFFGVSSMNAVVGSQLPEPAVGSAPPWAGVTPAPSVNREMARTPFCSQVLLGKAVGIYRFKLRLCNEVLVIDADDGYKGERATMRYYRFHNFPVAADAPLGATFARVKECLDKAGVRKAPLRFCLHGPRGCATIVARFPELRRFLSTAGRQSGDTPVEHLSNYGPSAPGAFAGPSGEAAPETIAAVAAGIPDEFPISTATFALGPILRGATRVPSSRLHSRFLEMNLQSVQLSWQSSPTRDGRKYFLSFNEPLPTADAKQPVPAGIKTLYSAFPGAKAEKISSDIDHIMVEYRMVTSYSSGAFIGSKSIGEDLKLPHELPDSQAASHLNHAPLRGFHSTIAGVFEDDGWKEAPGIKQTGIHQLRKKSPGGRRLVLLFWIQKSGRSSRSLSGLMRLVSERRMLTLGVLAERSTRRDYEVPNPQVLSQILENMRVVVKYLENTWVADLEEVLGPRYRDSKPGGR